MAITVLYIVFLTSPQMKNINETKFKLNESEKKIAVYMKTMLDFPGFFKTQQDLFQKKNFLISKLYSKDDLIKLFDRIQKMSLISNIALIEISPSVDELLDLNRRLLDSDKPQPLDIVVRFRGSLLNTGRYIKEIEAEDFFNGINYCRINNHVENQRDSDVSFGFKAILGTIKGS
jgi:hypothetical protein